MIAVAVFGLGLWDLPTSPLPADRALVRAKTTKRPEAPGKFVGHLPDRTFTHDRLYPSPGPGPS